MNIYCIRHADAVPVGEQGVDTDEERPLSERGVRQAQLLAQGLKRLGITPGPILSSPLRRAWQTAEELARGLQASREPIVCEELAPGHSTKRLAKHLLRVEAENLFLVGHEPDLSQHTAWLIGSKEAQLEFAKGGIACVECDGAPQKGGGTLAWLVTPKWLKAVFVPD